MQFATSMGLWRLDHQFPSVAQVPKNHSKASPDPGEPGEIPKLSLSAGSRDMPLHVSDFQILFQVISSLVSKQALLEHLNWWTQFSPHKSRWEDARPRRARTTWPPAEQRNDLVIPPDGSSSAVSRERICWWYVRMGASLKNSTFMEAVWSLRSHQPQENVLLMPPCIANPIFPCTRSGFTNSDYLRFKLEIALFQQRATPWFATPNTESQNHLIGRDL